MKIHAPRLQSILPVALLILHVHAQSATASDLPAVSEPNGVVGAQLAALGDGNGDDHAFGLLAGGQWTMPIAHQFGARAALNAGISVEYSGSPREAASGLLGVFWRRPEQGFVELSAGGTHLGPANRYVGGLIGGLFRGVWDFEAGAAGFGNGGSLSGGGWLGIGRYLSDDLHLAAEASAGSEETYRGELSITWQPDLPQNLGFRFIAGGGAIGGDASYSGVFEVFYYFGEARTLRQKLREDW